MLFTSAPFALKMLFVAAVASVSVHQEWQGVIRATLAADAVYTLGSSRKPDYLTPRTFGGGMLSIHRCPINVEKVEPHHWLAPIMVEWHKSPHAPLRWRLDAGKIHVGSFWPIEPNAGPRYGGIEVFSTDDLAFCSTFPRDPRQNAQRSADLRLFQSRMEYGPRFCPYSTHFIDDRIYKNRVRPQVFFDFLTYKSVGYETFVVTDGKLTRSCIEPRQNNRDADWVKKESWKTGWTEPFYVAENGDDLFFVTHSGKLFYALRNGTPGTLLGDIWKDKPPIQALIHDADSKKSYAFTKDEFFEIAGEPRPKPHTLTIRREVTASKALEAAVKCGKLIREPKR